jgi:deoxyribose-phosphate aldolase
LTDGADEIDCVLPYRSFRDGDEVTVTDVLTAVHRVVEGRAHLKVILETGELISRDLVTRAARLAISCGADFIKTSTGKTPVSATPDAVRWILDVIASSERVVGIKPSGGIRTLADASVYLDLADEIMGPSWATPATFRFGASGLLDDLTAVIT